MNAKQEWINKGYADEPIDPSLDIKAEIQRLKIEKNAVILAHYYQKEEIQEIADYVGDSLALAQWAAKSTADILVMCGVHFMGETAKILCPEKKVLVPDMNAGCSLADSCPSVEFGYINSVTGRNMLLWNGACHVHEQFSLDKLKALKAEYPDALVLVHPECKKEILDQADIVGSTAALLKGAKQSSKSSFIVVTEAGILHEMRKQCPEKTFIPLPPEGNEHACNECDFMRLNTLEKLYNCLKYEYPVIEVDAKIAAEAVKPIHRMLEISERLGL